MAYANAAHSAASSLFHRHVLHCEQGKPFKFKLGSEQVVPGLDEGVGQLSIGERAKITMPPSKAYGSKGFPGLVPPNTSLIFDLQLITFT